MDKIKPVPQPWPPRAAATTIPKPPTGGIRADLSVPKELGGPRKAGLGTPEHLFAAGYAACFGRPSYARAILTTEELLALLAAAREKKYDDERSRSLENATL